MGLPESGLSEQRRAIEQAWERFVTDGIAPGGLRGEISDSWRRVRETYGIDPTLKQPRRVLGQEELEARIAQDEVLRVAEPVLREFAGVIPGHVLAYLDGDGWLLRLDGDRDVASQVEQIHFRPGVNWTEASAGTNGPGTALASGRPVEVFASEHFVSAWQSWSCAAAPLRMCGAPAPVGLVDVTGPWNVHSREALTIARLIARAVEERLRAIVSVRDEVLRHAFRAAQSSGDAVIAVDARGRVIARNDAAARLDLLADGGLPPPMREALSATLVGSPAGHEGELRAPREDLPPFSATSVRHEGRAVGAILRVPAGERVSRHRAPGHARYHFGRILGGSSALRRAIDLARTATGNDLPVVLSGESGTGKELFAQAIHSASARAEGPFVAVNCGSIPAHLVEAELFGYEAGAFTGAKRQGNPGRFEDACRGTLFLDEVSELPLQAQTVLLRVLQEKEVTRIGGGTPRPVDVRIVAATNKPLDEEVRARRFRRDLYYRLAVLPLTIPPLREREGDIALLAKVFLDEAQLDVRRTDLSFSPDALAALAAHDWPGNVRELRNVILRAAATCPGYEITAEQLSLQPAAGAAPHPEVPAPPPATAGGTLKDALLASERARLLEALESTGWNVAASARQLGVSRMTIYRLLQKFGLSREDAG